MARTKRAARLRSAGKYTTVPIAPSPSTISSPDCSVVSSTVPDLEPKQKAINKGRPAPGEAVAAGSNKGGKGTRMRKKRKSPDNYSCYLYKILKFVAGNDFRISVKGMNVVNSFIVDIFERLGKEASVLRQYAKKTTLTARDIQSAVKLLLPGELGRHAANEGTKAMETFNLNTRKGRVRN